MKNEVRPSDANAAIEALRANFQQGSWYGCEDPLYQIAEDTIAEMPTLEDHFPNPTKMIPLTLEQLREMDGKPVWVHVIDHTVFADKEDDFDGWGMCRKSWVRIWDSKRADIVHIDYDFEDYGKEWVAYAYPPAHIDQEAWEPCECCKEPIGAEAYKKEKYPGICDFEVILDGGDEITVNAYNHYTPVTEEICFSFHVSFCPKCGRPLTEEAWAELEKRMGLA